MRSEAKCLLGILVVIACAAVFHLASAGIRLDGTEVQGSGGQINVPSELKGAQAVAAPTLVFTAGQAIMAQGQAASGSEPVRIGLGYEYNLLYTSFCRCACHADPVCDGVATVQDVVKTVGVAFRGDPPTTDTDCAHAGRTDIDCSGFTTVIDVVRMVDVAFRGADPAVRFCRPCTD